MIHTVSRNSCPICCKDFRFGYGHHEFPFKVKYEVKISMMFFYWVNTKILTCNVDPDATAQTACRPRNTAFHRPISVNDTKDIGREYTVVDGPGQQQVFAFMVYG